jgi:hypothetical protein
MKKISPTTTVDDSILEPSTISRNPRMLILDFLMPSPDNLRVVNATLIEQTQIRKYSLKYLKNGGVSILFASEQAKRLAEPILLTKLENKLKRKGFMNTKKLFEVSVSLPKQIDRQKLMESIHAERYVERFGNQVVYFMRSLEAAKQLISDGFIFDNFFLMFKAFVFKPKVGCKTCGSLQHVFCELSNERDETKECIHCGSEEHVSVKCALYETAVKEAKANKKKTYASALSSSAVHGKQIYSATIAAKSTSRSSLISQASTDTSLTKNQAPKASLELITQIVSAVLIVLNVQKDPAQISKAVYEGLRASFTEAAPVNPIVTSASEEKEWPVLEPTVKKSKVEVVKAKKSVTFKLDTKDVAKKAKENGKVNFELDILDQNVQEKEYKQVKTRYAQAIVEKGNAMQGVEVSQLEENVQDTCLADEVVPFGNAHCACGHLFSAGSGAKSHLSRKKPCSDKPEFICTCGSMKLSIENWSTSYYGRFITHLKTKCRSSALETNVDHDC